jgi:hypothetical protein
MELYSAIKKNEIVSLKENGWSWGAHVKKTKSVPQKQVLHVFSYL